MHYLRRLGRLRAFRKTPFTTLANAALLVVLLLLRRGFVFQSRFGSRHFRFRYVHGKRHAGGRGFLLSRARIEDLMEYGDRFLRHGDVVIDGGANQGIFTTAFASYIGAEGRVLAVEPMPYAVERIRDNAALNGFANVTVFEGGLSDQAGTATLDLSRGVGSASITTDLGGTETREIATATIDGLVAEYELDRVDFIKLDIEGAEFLALRGAAQTIARHRPVICLEVKSLETSVEAHKHLLSLGYRLHAFDGEVLQPAARFEPPYANAFYLPAN